MLSYPKENACHFIGVGGVVIQESKVLLVKLSYGPAAGKWLIPGGLVDPGETLQEAVIREICEETGQYVIPLGIIGVRTMVRESDRLTDLYCIFLCELQTDQKEFTIDQAEVREVTWMPISQLNDDPDVTGYTRIIVTKALTQKPMNLDKELGDARKRRFGLLKYEHYWVTD